MLAIAAGSLLGGTASDLLARRFGARAGLRAPGIVGLPLAALAVAVGVATRDPMLAVLSLAAAAGLSALGVAPAWAACLAIGGRHAGVVSGAMNTFGNLGGATSPLVIGWCLEAWGSWETPLYTVAVFYLGSAACWLAIDPPDPLEARAAVADAA
jgi:nitrate/nitrite transporter NarK